MNFTVTHFTFLLVSSLKNTYRTHMNTNTFLTTSDLNIVLKFYKRYWLVYCQLRNTRSHTPEIQISPQIPGRFKPAHVTVRASIYLVRCKLVYTSQQDHR